MSPFSSASTPPKSGRWSRVPMAPRESCFWNAFAPADGTCAARCHEGDLGLSRLKGRLAHKLHQSDGSAQGRGADFSARRATIAGFWRRPLLARLGLSDESRLLDRNESGLGN